MISMQWALQYTEDGIVHAVLLAHNVERRNSIKPSHRTNTHYVMPPDLHRQQVHSLDIFAVVPGKYRLPFVFDKRLPPSCCFPVLAGSLSARPDTLTWFVYSPITHRPATHWRHDSLDESVDGGRRTASQHFSNLTSSIMGPKCTKPCSDSIEFCLCICPTEDTKS
jgi:hypothetical protein